MKKAEIVKAAKELNDVLGLEPAIGTKGKKLQEIEENILEAAGLIQPDDDISEATLNVINALAVFGKDNDEEEVSHEEKIEEEEKPAPKKEKKEKPAKEKKEEKKNTKPANQTTHIFTRSHAAGLAIAKGKGKTKEEIIKDADQIFIEKGEGASNMKESRTLVNYALKALEGFGAIKIKDDVIQ